MYHTMSSLFAEASISLSGLVWHLIEERFTALVAWDRGDVHVIEEFPVREQTQVQFLFPCQWQCQKRLKLLG